MTLVIIVIVAVIVIVGIALIVSYNRFVTQRNLIDESWRRSTPSCTAATT